jgi:hypothetical protein
MLKDVYDDGTKVRKKRVTLQVGGQVFHLTFSIRDPGVDGTPFIHIVDDGITAFVISVLEPGAMAMLVGMGFSGSLDAMRLRRRRK